jgi:glutathione S-transferase
MEALTLISHALCPYVQRAAIAMTEKGMSFDRRVVDLANRPDWFRAVSPLGKTPVLLTQDTAIFESAVILEYLEDIGPRPLHPFNPLRRAEHRSWIEFGSAILNDIAGLYSAGNAIGFETKRIALKAKFERVEAQLDVGPFFEGEQFSAVDAVYGPIFRYFDVFDGIADFGIFEGLNKCLAWRSTLSARSSVKSAVGADYCDLLRQFLAARKSHISSLM